LVSDLSRKLPTLPYAALIEGNLREKAWPGITAREYACLALGDSLLKKFQDQVSPEADGRALAKFLAFNNKCNVKAPIDRTSITEIEEIAVGEASRTFYEFWFRPGGDYILSVDSISAGLAVGPGASIGVKGNDFYRKVCASLLTGTRKSLYTLYKRETSKYPLWEETENIRSNHFGGFKEVPGSRLSFVPKTRDISRTICTEPLLNMMVQKGIGAVIEQQLLARFGINLASQPSRNRILARIGSEHDTYSTIDLSNASDSVSCSLMRELLPPYILSWIMEARSEAVELPDGSSVPLHMVSSMGNAFTFPLQTALFASVVLGVYKALDITAYKPYHHKANFGVFGDDIIVEKRSFSMVCRILERFGFTVNGDKSFGSGPFRESCGSDFWSGYDVRGIYCQSLRTKQDVYSLINRLNVWSANHEVPLSDTIRYLVTGLGKIIYPIPVWDADDAGLKVPLEMLPLSKLRGSKKTGGILYNRYTPRHKEISLLAVESRPVVRRKWFDNHPGILLTAISGHLRGGSIVERVDRPHYIKRIALAPCWDWYNPCYSKLQSNGWHRFKTYVALNLETVELQTFERRTKKGFCVREFTL
jgi:hypothetical protein